MEGENLPEQVEVGYLESRISDFSIFIPDQRSRGNSQAIPIITLVGTDQVRQRKLLTF